MCAGSIIGHLRPLQSTLALYSEDKASMSSRPLGTAARQRAGRRSLASRKALPESQNGRKTCLKSLPAEEDFTVIWAAIATGLLVSSQNLYKRQGHMCTHTHTHMLTQHKNSRKSQPCERKRLSGITSWAYLRYLPRPRNFTYSVLSGEHGQVAVQNPYPAAGLSSAFIAAPWKQGIHL